MRAIVGAEKQRAVDVDEPYRRRAATAGIDVRDLHSPSRRTVARPQLPAVAIVLGREEEGAVDVVEPGDDLDGLDRDSPTFATVALPQRSPVFVDGHEEQGAVDGGESERRAGKNLDRDGPCFGAIAFPQRRSVSLVGGSR